MGKAIFCVGVGAAIMMPTVARGAASDSTGEIIVTARKRDESLLNVPVVETVVTARQLEMFRPQDLKDVAKLVPGLQLGTANGSQGTQVSLRGVGTTAINAGIDQPISLIIDGLQMSQGIAFSSGVFDVAQIEVLKGPQALFQGKNSPGGVIALRTADPTGRFEVSGRYGYEPVSDQHRGELILSGPVSNTLRLRVAGMYSHDGGYFTNAAVPQPGTGARAPSSDKGPRIATYIIRGTALWNPSANFDARLKATYLNEKQTNIFQTQYVSCPEGNVGTFALNGTPVGFLGGEDCKLDRVMRNIQMDPVAFPGIPNDGYTFMNTKLKYGSLELNYRPSSQITLTSVTGYYDAANDSMPNGAVSTSAGSTLAIPTAFRQRNWSEELRANSSFDGPINFTLGAYYQHGRLTVDARQIGNILYGLAPVLSATKHNIETDSVSTFGQARWAVVAGLELAAGARWTSEMRTSRPLNLISGTPVAWRLRTPRIKSDNVSPEFTATYKPAENITLFASYKTGYKSGSFNIGALSAAGAPGAPGLGQELSFKDERVKGGEVGVKTLLVDRSLTANIAYYNYTYRDLQVGTNEVLVPGTAPQARTVNAGKAKIYGVDVDLAYRPRAIEGLGVNASVMWNHARFITLNNIPCGGGQTFANGCNQQFNAVTGFFAAQDLSGIPLVRAPDWQATFGFDYELPIGREIKLILANSNRFSSRYLTSLSRRSDFYFPSYLKSDMSATLKGPDNRWELAVIGKNLQNKLTTGNCLGFNAANGAFFGGQVTGATPDRATTRGPAGIDEIECYVDRGREIWLQVTFRPFG